MGVVALSAWAALAPLASAVVAEGTVKTAGNRKTVQHAEGGIVSAIHVKDGDRVVAGQALITLADQRVAAGADALRQQWVAEAAKAQRLSAESQQTLFAPQQAQLAVQAALVETAPGMSAMTAALQTHFSAALLQEQAVYAARAHQQAEQSRWLALQLQQVRAEMAAHAQLITTTQSAHALAQKELANNDKLRADGFVSEAKIIELQRSVADYRAKTESAQAQHNQAQQKEADLQMRMAALKSDFARQAADELKTTREKLAQTRQELRPAQDAQARQTITAPVDGEVVDLKVHTPGSAIGPREPILDLVPSSQALVIEAHIAPQDIHDLQHLVRAAGAGQAANASVMLSAYRSRATPQVAGRISYLGADRLQDATTRAPYYVAHITVSAQALQQASALAGQALTLSPGMQAEVFMATQERTALRYLLDPIFDGVRRSMRER